MNDPIILVYAGIFAATLLAADTFLRLVFRARARSGDVRNHLEGLKAKTGTEDAFQQLLLRRGVSGGHSESFGKMLERFYTQSGLEISTVRRVIYLVILLLLGYTLSALFISANPFIAGVAGFVFALLISFLVVYRSRARRIKRFTEQLAPAIDIIVRSLNAGHPLNSAISLVSREMPDPIGSEFGILNDQMTFGSDLDESMRFMIDRVGAPELELLAVTVSVQRGTGGNLSEILENLAQMIRDRLMIKSKIKAISAEGRMTMWIMLAFPFVLFAMIRGMVPDYFDPVWESGYGGVVVTICLVFMMFGAIIIRRLVNFDF